ncbi:hypothetical protein JD78_00555 [Modestobacter roseus]|uniref:Uncharacterized protein n=1 Tax=Modestobacter roseus TaxID=1181884 RepID=A0A562IM15_9ACTN|nr:hypothetical protein JD78_00555 [Modestobacter roseus]
MSSSAVRAVAARLGRHSGRGNATRSMRISVAVLPDRHPVVHFLDDVRDGEVSDVRNG